MEGRMQSPEQRAWGSSTLPPPAPGLLHPCLPLLDPKCLRARLSANWLPETRLDAGASLPPSRPPASCSSPGQGTAALCLMPPQTPIPVVLPQAPEYPGPAPEVRALRA